MNNIKNKGYPFAGKASPSQQRLSSFIRKNDIASDIFPLFSADLISWFSKENILRSNPERRRGCGAISKRFAQFLIRNVESAAPMEMRKETCWRSKSSLRISAWQKSEKVIEGISMTVEPGEVMCVLGSNGIGKTTLFRSVLGGIPLLGER